MTEQLIPNVEIGYSVVKGTDPFTVGFDAATKALETIIEHPLSVLLIHIKGNKGFNEALAGIASVTEDIPVLGFSSAQLATNPDTLEISAVSIASPFLTVNVGIGDNISKDWKRALKDAIESEEIIQYFGPHRAQTWKDLVGVGKSAFGMILTTVDQKDNMTPFLKELRAISENTIPFIGGSALNISGQKTGKVLHNQLVYSDALIVTIIETNLRVGTSMAHGFSNTGKKLTVTKTKGKSITELNGTPAFRVWQSIENPSHTTLGLVDSYGGSRYLVVEESSIEKGLVLTESIPKGTVLSVLQPEGNDLEEAGIEAFNKAVIRGNIEEPILAMVFSSIHRRAMLSNRLGEEITDARSSRPSMHLVGFDTSGEIGLTDEGLNWYNQKTVSVLVLGQHLSYAAEVAIQNKELLGRLSFAEASQRALLDLMPDAILATNQALTITHWNPQAQRLLGHSKENVMGLNVTNILHPRLRWTLENKAQALAEGDTHSSISFEAEVVKFDKTLVPVEVTISFNPHQERYSFVIAFHDITEHKTSESILDKERKAYKSIAEAAINTSNLEDLCKQTLDGIMETLEYDIGTVRIFDDERQVLTLFASSGIDENEVEKILFVKPFEDSGHLGTDSAFTMEAVFSPNVQEDKSLVGRKKRLEEMGIEAIVTWPLTNSTGDLLGVLNLASYAPKDDSDESRLFFEVLAGMFATVIERRVAQEALGESETKVRTILQSMRDMVFVFDEHDQHTEIYFSDPTLLYGNPAEMLGKHLSDSLPASVADKLVRTAKRVRQTKTPETLDYSLEIDNRTVWFSANISPHEDGKSVVSVSRDITARKEAETELAKRLEYEKTLATISQSLLMGKADTSDSIQYTLEALLEVTNSGRVYIFENVTDTQRGLSMQLLAEASADKLEKEGELFPNRMTPYSDGFSRWRKELSEGRYIVGSVNSFPEQEKPKFEELGVKAVLVIPLWIQDKWFGYIGFDDTKEERQWTIDEIRLLRTAAEMVSGYIARTSTDAELRSSVRDLELYSSILRHDLANDIMLILNQIEAAEIL